MIDLASNAHAHSLTEGQRREDDFLFFGYVCGFDEEWGYFVLSELASVGGQGRLSIERDLYFKPGRLSSCPTSLV